MILSALSMRTQYFTPTNNIFFLLQPKNADIFFLVRIIEWKCSCAFSFVHLRSLEFDQINSNLKCFQINAGRQAQKHRFKSDGKSVQSFHIERV